MKLATFRNALKAGSIDVLRQEIFAVQADEAADLLKQMTPAEGIVFLRLLGKDVALDAFEQLSPAEQAEIVEGLDNQEIGPLLDQLDPSDLVELLDELPAKIVNRVVHAVGTQTRQDLSLLLGFPEDSVGRNMSPRYLAVRSSDSVQECLNRIRTSTLDEDELDAVFVFDQTRKLEGVVALAALLRAESGVRVGELANGAPPVMAHEPLESATKTFRRVPVSVLPVVDREGRLIGCIRAADAIELVEEEDAARLTQFGGTSALGGPDIDLRHSTLGAIYRARVIWLALLTFFGVVTSTYVAQQEEMLSQVIVLAAFIAPIIDMGGNTGSQSATMVIRAMALGQIRMNWSGFWFALRRDLLVAAGLAVTIGVLEVVLAYFSKGVGFDVLLVVGLTMFIVTILGSLIGLALPFVARKFGADPATLSAPAITSIMDLLGVVIYFGLAALFLGHLLQGGA